MSYEGGWFSLAKPVDGRMVEFTNREYSAFDENGLGTRCDTLAHTYETRLDEWGDEYEAVVDSWPTPSIQFQVPAGTYDLSVAFCETVQAEPLHFSAAVLVTFATAGSVMIVPEAPRLNGT